MTRTLIAADLFCGAGGTSQGAEDSGAAKVACAVNHWDVAIRTHSANFPLAKHIHSRLDQVNPSECPRVDLLFASPECTHHSRARGGKPTSDQQRAGAWDLMRWVEFHRPSWLVIENVAEFREWGPVGDNGVPLSKFRGRFFGSWLQAIESAGYRTEHRLLNAADFGATTSRERLFVIARKGNRAIPWPDGTHSAKSGGELPGFGLSPWRAAAEVIDWSLPCQSIFGRSRPLADKTLLRIEAGLRKFVAPFVVKFRSDESGESASLPLSTITAGGGHHGLAIPFQFQLIGRGSGRSRSVDASVPTIIATREQHGVVMPFVVPYRGEREGQEPRSHALHDPLPTITTEKGAAIAVPFLSEVNHGDNKQHGGRSGRLDAPLGTVSTHNGRALVVPFLSHYYGTANHSPVTAPADTITTKPRHALVVAQCLGPDDWPAATSDAMRTLQATMKRLGVADIGFRMLQNPELAAAQGFPSSYVFHGNKAEVTRQIGNSVSPPVAQAITLAIAGI